MSIGNRMPSQIISYKLHLYFIGLSFRNIDKVLSFLKIHETIIKVGPEYIWVWVVTIEPKDKEILRINISK